MDAAARGYIFCIKWILVTIFLGTGVKSTSILPSLLKYNRNFDTTENAFIVPFLMSDEFFPLEHALAIFGFAEEVRVSSCIKLTVVFEAPASGDYLVFSEKTTPTDCEPAFFGRQNSGRNEVTYGGPCTELQVRRILYAAIGVYYQHQRSDRNDHVVFTPSSATGLLIDIPSPAPKTYGTPYDLSSFMSVPSVAGVQFYGLPPAGSTQLVALTENDNLSELDEVYLLRLYTHHLCPIAEPCSTNNPCQNSGTCLDRKQLRPFCACTEYFTGENCETRLFQCQADTCKNSGVCIEEANGAIKCNCVGLFTGDTCEDGLLHPGWIDGKNGYQYKVTNAAANWYEANHQCKLEGADLAHNGIRDPPTFDLLKTTFTQSPLWIGFSTHVAEKYYWNDQTHGRNVVDIPWGFGQPVPGDSYQCVALADLPGERALANCDCSDLAVGLCEKPIGNPLTYGAYRPGNGRMYFRTPEPSKFRVAKAQCLERGGHLIVYGAATSTELKDIVDNVLKTSNDYAFVGFEAFGTPNEYKAIIGDDSLPFGDPRWDFNQPSMSTYRYGYGYNRKTIKWKRKNAVVTSTDMDGKLKNVNDGDTKAYGLCEAPEISECTCEGGECVTVVSTGASACMCSYGYKPDTDGSCIAAPDCP